MPKWPEKPSCFTDEGYRAAVTGTAPEWVVICGVWTEACVAASCRDAVAVGYRVLLVKDVCGSDSRHMHETGFITLANRLYGGAGCDTACRLKSGETAPAWRLQGAAPLHFDGLQVQHPGRKSFARSATVRLSCPRAGPICPVSDGY